jgi:type II secretory pathway component GspD/PulD (secretin)
MEAPDQMTIESVVLEYSEAAGDALGLGQYNVEGQSTSRTHDLSGDEFEALLKASRQNEGVTVLATPVVTTATGQDACNFIGRTLYHQTGTRLYSNRFFLR